MDTQKYFKAQGIYYRNELKTIRKKTDTPLQPIYESFMNAWEAILDKFTEDGLNRGTISISFHFCENLINEGIENADFTRVEVSDNGIGLNDASFLRLINLRDDSKKRSNLGTGRVQYLHFFDNTVLRSVYNSGDSNMIRQVTMSKKEQFLSNNAILRIDVEKKTRDRETGTTIIFDTLLDTKDLEYYTSLKEASAIKGNLVKHFLSLFCEHRDKLPQIIIKIYLGESIVDEAKVTTESIPQPDKEGPINLNYSRLNEKNEIIYSERKEEFRLKAFKRPASELTENEILLVSKGAVGTSIELYNLQKKDSIENYRYLFLLTGKYFDENDRDDRGNMKLITGKEFKSQNESNLFPEEVILIDTIKENTNLYISQLYKEIRESAEQKNRNIDELQSMFLLNNKTVEKIRKKIKNTDSDEAILKAIYEADSKIEAEKDSEIKKKIDELKYLTPNKTEDYRNTLQSKVDELVRAIPLQNRTILSKYVARRKLVLDLFEQILNNELDSLRNGGRINESLLHNLIFQQSTSSQSPEDSDLWLINEDFIYFKGVSEKEFKDMEYSGKMLFDKEFSEEDKRYLNSLNERRLTKRPDILLFPEEGKAIIIEFKAPDVNVSEHLTQIDFYASILRNYTIEDVKLTTFYGYLIGENIEDRDVRGRVSRFEQSMHLNYWFRPSEKVINFNKGEDGTIYTEIMKYSTLLKRAKLRNKVFIDRLLSSSENNK